MVIPIREDHASWMPHAERLRPFYRGIDQFVQEHLQYTRDAKHGPIVPGEKSILDPLVGYVHFEPWEASIIDTPLVQRLKRVTQLGLASLVYPTLGYSRFEHTIGVVGRLAQVMSTLRGTHSRTGTFDPGVAQTVSKYYVSMRLAALLHDIGHCAFSHVSERTLETLPGSGAYPSSVEIRDAFNEHFRPIKDISLSEVLSVAIVGSTSLREFIRGLDIPEKTDLKTEYWLECAARFIMGLPISGDPDTLFLAQTVSSGLDIDKLDYMCREAYFAGIKLEIDLERILDKLRVFKVPARELLVSVPAYRGQLESEKDYRVLGLARGGQFVFEEFCISRVSLYEKIYLHQKIRAAEAQLTAALRRLMERHQEFAEAHNWLYLRESCVDNPEATIPALRSQGPLFDAGDRTFKPLHVDEIANRTLVHRAYAFGPANSITDPHSPPGSAVKNGKVRPSDLLLDEVTSNPKRFLEQVLSEVVAIVGLLKHKENALQISDLIVDPPRYRSVQQGHDTIYFEKASRLPLRWTMPVDRIVDYYYSSRALGYVFAPREYCPVVLLAAEMVAWRQKACVFVQETFVAERELKQVESLRKSLSETGYYDDALPLKPVSKILHRADVQAEIEALAVDLSDFESHKHQRVTVSHITTFLSQFPESLHEVGVEWLRHFRLYGAEELEDTIRSVFTAAPVVGHQRLALVPLGGVADSAMHLMYAVSGMRQQEGLKQVPDPDNLNDNLISRADYLVFVDDNVNTGLQVLNIFAGWMGIDLPDEVKLNEAHVQPLSENAAKVLREKPLSLVFVVGTEDSQNRVKGLLSKYLGWDGANVHVHVQHLLRDSKKVFSGAESDFQSKLKGDLRKFVMKIGKQLLLAEGKSDEAAAEKSLGYGKAEGMVVFPYNVPTMTVTALWCAGKVEGKTWIPLVERKRRKSIDGLIVGEDS